MRRIALLAALLPFAACSHHPLEGAWGQEVAGGGEGITLEFEIGGSRMLGHHEVDGQHKHIDGTYTFDAATNAVTVTAELLGKGNGDSFRGTVDGERLELGSADGKLTFHKTDHVQGH